MSGIEAGNAKNSGAAKKTEAEEKPFPEHVAIIMDGNGRWAEKRGLPRLAGHNAGMKAMKEIVRHSSEIGLKYLSVYAFSTENWKRSAEEVSGIFRLLVSYVESELKEICENNVRIRILGDTSALPKAAYEAVERATEATKDNDGLHFCVALNYGGRADILRAAKETAYESAKELIITSFEEDMKGGSAREKSLALLSALSEKLSGLDEKAFSERLYTAGMPDPDLIIRTGGEVRISNFMLWQLAYSEMIFTNTLWPDFTPKEFDECIESFQKRERRYGGRISEAGGA